MNFLNIFSKGYFEKIFFSFKNEEINLKTKNAWDKISDKTKENKITK